MYSGLHEVWLSPAGQDYEADTWKGYPRSDVPFIYCPAAWQGEPLDGFSTPTVANKPDHQHTHSFIGKKLNYLKNEYCQKEANSTAEEAELG